MPLKRRNLHFSAQRRSRKRDRNIAVQIVFFPSENFMFTHMDNDVEISGSTTSNAGFPIPQRTDARAIIDSGRYLHPDPRSLFLPSVSSAFPAGTLNHLSG